MTSLHMKTSVKQPQAPADLGHRAARGLLWLMGQTIGVKVVSFVANVVLAYFLSPHDAGLVGMAYTVLSIAGIVQFIGMQDVLVQRQANFRRWSNAAFWMLLTVGLLGGGLTALAAPLAADLFNQPRLVGMVLLLALASPLHTTSVLPQAVLASQLRFGTSVLIGTSAAVGTSILSIVFAALGFGAYSFLLPVPLVALLQAVALWWVAHPPVRLAMQLRRWRFLVGDTGYNWGISVCIIIITTADHVVLSLKFPATVVGVYFWAVTFSTQLLRLLAMNLTSVLLPSLSKLQGEPERQAGAFVQAMQVLALIGIPACLLQAALAEPLVRILYADRWESVGQVLAALSVGMAFYFISGPAVSIMKARAEFRSAFFIHAVNAILMVAIVTALALTANSQEAALRVAIGAAACLAVFGPFYLFFAIRVTRHGWRAVLRVYAAPTVASILAIGPAVGLARLTPDMPGRDFLVVAIVLLVSGILYPILIRWIDPQVWAIAMARIRSLRRPSGPRAKSPPQ